MALTCAAHKTAAMTRPLATFMLNYLLEVRGLFACRTFTLIASRSLIEE